MSGIIDLSHKKFGRLTVISLGQGRPSRWLCRCDCGNEKTVRGGNLTSGNTVSCGCWNNEMRSKLGSSHRTKTAIPQAQILFQSEYRAWSSMLSRCNNPKHKSYKNYGARGIGVCDRWQQSFDNFLSDVGQKPSASLSLDRIDNEKDYTPENCHWATPKQQMNNVRYNVLVTIDGETRTLAHWVERFGIARSTVESRILKGEPLASAITRPARFKRKSSTPAL